MTWACVDEPALDLADVDGTYAGGLVVVGPSRDRVADAAAALGSAPRLVDEAVAVGLCRLVIGWDLGTPELGPPALLPARDWLLAVRRLALRLLLREGTDVVAVPGPVWQLMYLRRVLPEVRFVLATAPGEDAEWDARLAEVRRPHDVVPEDRPPAVPSPGQAPAGSAPRGGRLLLVVGSGRSGTTWAHRLLCAHDGVTGTALGETWVFRLLSALWQAAGAQDAADDVVAALRDFVREVLLDALDPSGTRVVSEKTPAHSWQVPLVRHLLPDARVVHVLRDGRDVALSLVALDGAFPDLPSAGRAWRRATEAIDRDGGDVAHVLRYEDLRADPVGAVVEVWERLGLRVTDDDRQRVRDRAAERVSPLPVSGDGSDGRWQALSRKEQRALEKEIGTNLQRWGYPARR